MSAGDALAAIQVIHTVVSKVKDNKDELNSLSNRLRFIVQSLEASRQRDVIRDAEYEDSLSTVFELISRAERLSRRMLKRSLGDRTWNAREITNDLRRLNEDVQAFLSVHTIQAVDFIHTAQSQQQAYLVSSVEEIIAKIAEIDLALSDPKPEPKIVGHPHPHRQSRRCQSTLPIGSVAGVTADLHNEQDPLHLPTGSSPRSKEGSSSQIRGGRSGGIQSLGTQITSSSVRPRVWAPEPPATMEEDIDDSPEPKLLVDKLRSANLFTLTVSGLHPSGEQYGPGSLEAKFDIPGGATVDQIKDIIEQSGYQRPEGLIEDRTMFIKVTNGDSVFDAMAPGGLQISKDEPLLWWMNRYDEYHGITAPIPMKTEVEWTRDSLKVDNLTIHCHRTLRVPDSGEVSQLPPDMGAFPIFPIAHLGSRLVPKDMKKRGGFIMPMFRREALWISFECGYQRPAVKVSVGDTAPLKNGPQDYVVAGQQPWIDGIVTEAGIVRQGGIHWLHTRLGAWLYPVIATPAELQLEGKTIAYVRWEKDASPSYSWKRGAAFRDIKSPTTEPWLLSRYARRISANPNLKARYPVLSVPLCHSASTGFPRRSKGFSNPGSLSRVPSIRPGSSLGIAAGGRIKQNIYRDSGSVRDYNEQIGRRVHIHIVTPEFWEDLTGVLPPITPITRGLYESQGIPWFKLFDDYVDSIAETSEALASVLPVSELDKIRSDSAVNAQDSVVNPDAPPRCFQHALATSSCVFRPCGHAVCPLCLGHALLGGSNCPCGSAITKFVGMKQPLPQVDVSVSEDLDDDGMQHWSVQEIEQLSAHAVKHGKVVVIHRPEDSVAPLQQRDPISPTRPY
ncbi:hypothetical protein NMY22_g2314 [Coprinellus aureogranulatus]|nr:hypothetical protein NMY22_g2314 [Coprinellus aureogranulatus]